MVTMENIQKLYVPLSVRAMLLMITVTAVVIMSMVANCYSLSLSLSLHFNGHLPGEPGLAGVH